MEGLLIILGEKPYCYITDKLRDIIEIRNTLFKEIEENNYSGFYDWLRDDTEAIIGLRYARLDGLSHTMFDAMQKLPYVKLPHEKIIEVYFTSMSNYKEDISNDQDFGVCKVYKSDINYAILLDISFLTKDELFSIPIIGSAET